jgi:hypothetical protein
MQPLVGDAFISYRHLDNQSASNTLGWIDDFHRRLEIRLGELLGREPLIWRDPKLSGGDYFTDEIRDNIVKAKVLITILSPGYIKSEWCLRELREFCDSATLGRGLRIANKARVVKVVKTAIPRDEHPPVIQELLGYEFFEQDTKTGKSREFSTTPQGHQHQRYLDGIEDIALYINDLILIMDRIVPIPPPPKIEKTVYLAETTSDVAEVRNKVMRELRDRGYYILPDRQLPLEMPGYQEAVKECLTRCRLSIHLIGKSYGVIPDGDVDKSVIELQNEIAADWSTPPKRSRVIWIPEGLETEANRRQSDFISRLQSEQSAQKGAELSRKSIEGLKTRIVEIMEAPEQPQPLSLTSIYLICDKADFDDVSTISEYLFDKGFEVIPSPKEGDQARVTAYHNEVLKECDATLIYYGYSDEMWIWLKLLDLKKALGLRGSSPIRCKAVLPGKPSSLEKSQLKTREARVLEPCYNGRTLDEVLEPFLSCLRDAHP